MPLTPEDRQRIYEEEKERLEVRRRLEQETSVPARSAKSPQNNEAAKNSGSDAFAGCLLSGLVVVGLLIWFGSSHMNAPVASSPPDYSASTSPYSAPAAFPNDSSPVPPDPQVEAALHEVEDKGKIIVQGVEFTYDGDYDYLKGNVKNNSPRTVTYWKATAQYSDKAGNIVDSAYTNSGETLLPGASKRFEIMHTRAQNGHRAHVFVEEVQFDPNSLPDYTQTSDRVKSSGYGDKVHSLEALIEEVSKVHFENIGEFDGRSEWEMTLVRNAPYARHGYRFHEAKLRAFFHKQAWYHPSIDSQDRVSALLSTIEQQNIETIKNYQNAGE